jgi:hypothetical protein
MRDNLMSFSGPACFSATALILAVSYFTRRARELRAAIHHAADLRRTSLRAYLSTRRFFLSHTHTTSLSAGDKHGRLHARTRLSPFYLFVCFADKFMHGKNSGAKLNFLVFCTHIFSLEKGDVQIR